MILNTFQQILNKGREYNNTSLEKQDLCLIFSVTSVRILLLVLTKNHALSIRTHLILREIER
ncbi:hypothetical protein EZS27_017635 [termite gut metagenome]|uniref:Uncharacterized protein n=1 Tax=termite gut metagenome TaxID=433724 RepID=A0A5J4RIP2_9ZZZZ